MGRHYRWVIVGVGALMTCVAMGAMFSLAVFLDPLSSATAWSRAGVSFAMSLNFVTMGLGAFGWGAASDRFGPRAVVLAGAALLGLALVLASQAQTLLQFQLVYGLLVGLAASAFFAPMIAAVTGWFTTHRSLAVSLVSAGMGVAPMTVSPFVRWAISAYDWRLAMLAVGVGAWVLLLPAALLVRRPPPAEPGGPAATPGERSGPSLGQALRSPAFLALGLTFFACCAAHSGPIFHMVSYAIVCGIGPMAAVSIYSVEGLAGLVGRVAIGVLADRYGVKPVLIGGLLIQALAIGTYVQVRELEAFYALAVVFGAAYGGVMPLYAVLAREYFGQAMLGSVFGAATMLSSFGMAIGPLAGGAAYDITGGYASLFIGSFAVALGALLAALLLPPLRSARAQAA